MTRSDRRVESGSAVERLFRDGRTNALASWLVVGVLALVLAESALDLDVLWLAFVAAAGLIVLVPPVAYREWRVMLPWELLALVVAPMLGTALLAGDLGTFTYYLSVAGVALLVTVELDMFTKLEVTRLFAVLLVVLTTMASAAAWTIVRWNADRLLGTSMLSTNDALMNEFVWVTLAGFAAGVLFDVYFTRRDRELWRAIEDLVGR
ncbi:MULTISPECIES: hypothetical protein [Halorussus]|uniref:hypothetical protein n=1 Tax=Halorussus TaxID=1070314 RepID=UPI000E210788|nr:MULTISPECIES: hypothetical protein [Halorussus]NHN59397.1 hypothetical protein [Halorussus sp. JP-T4]